MAGGVRSRRHGCRASRRSGKSRRPDGGGDVAPPSAATGSAAAEIIDAARRRTTSRRELAGDAVFDRISPEVGEIDEAALSEQLELDPDATLVTIARLTGATDQALRALAKRLAAQLFLDLARDHRPTSSGIGRIESVRYRPEGDVDLDGSLDPLVEARRRGHAVSVDDLRVHAWAAPSTAWCLLVDRSGSMQGEPVATAGLAAAAVAQRAEGEYAVLSFGRDVVACTAMWERHDPDDVIDRVLALRGHGTTDVAGALRAARHQLERASAQRRVTILLSDCRATEPGDVHAAARALDELVIVAPEADAADASELAGAVGARWTTASGPSSVIAALDRVLAR